ncbi:hypothetical protein NESM_000296900 [Novymonas esmeraldas]|uniref:Uncharacterized protein n=1 Tax=Novymonas esmeraldas TaxID=1808958 RepID=A0AAW0FEI7_9TRYP
MGQATQITPRNSPIAKRPTISTQNSFSAHDTWYITDATTDTRPTSRNDSFAPIVIASGPANMDPIRHPAIIEPAKMPLSDEEYPDGFWHSSAPYDQRHRVSPSHAAIVAARSPPGVSGYSVRHVTSVQPQSPPLPSGCGYHTQSAFGTVEQPLS